MELILNTLKIENFKAIKSFVLEPFGQNLAVTGKNKLGKTTVNDAYLWLLFGKNSAGETKFNIKPTDLPQEAENSVEATFTANGKPLTLKKVYASKFVKTTGEYKSSEIECYINGVPKKIREYEAVIAALIGEEQFRLLTNPNYFNSLDWKKKRETLFSLVSTMSDADMAAGNSEFSEIADDLSSCGTSTDLLKAIQAQIKNNSERINVLPKLINENTAKLSGSTAKIADCEKVIAELKDRCGIIQQEIGRLQVWDPQSSNDYRNAAEQLRELKERNAAYINEQKEKEREESSKIDSELLQIEQQLSHREAEYNTVVDHKQTATSNVNTAIRWKTDLESREWNGETVCPTCKQNLPAEKIEAAKKKFEADKAEKIAALTSREKELQKTLAEYEKELKARSAEITALKNKIAEIKAKKTISKGYFNLPNYEDNAAEIEKQLAELAALPNPNIEKIENLKTELNEINAKADAENAILNSLHNDENIQRRIKELKTEQANLRVSQAGLQKKLDMINSFIRYKVDMITDSVNGMFKIVKFKLFEPNKTNDGLQECCDAIAFGAARYGDINTAGKILAGIDIIATLSDKYGLSVPLFVDNIDSLDTDSYKTLIDSISGKMQLITLRVSDCDSLKTEVF